jgi:transcriptional regulator with XRE-family HTH domain
METKHHHADFAARMNEICADLGIPTGRGRQAQLGRMFGVTPKAARKWLLGEGFPELTQALEIADRAGVNINWLLQGIGPKRSDVIDTKALVASEALEALPDMPRHAVLQFMGFTLKENADHLFAEQLTRYLRALDTYRQPPKH